MRPLTLLTAGATLLLLTACAPKQVYIPIKCDIDLPKYTPPPLKDEITPDYIRQGLIAKQAYLKALERALKFCTKK